MLRLTDDTSIYTVQWASRKLHYLKMTENQTLFLSDNYIMLVGHNIWYLIFNLPPSPQCHRYLIHSLWLWIFDFEKSILHWNHVPCHPNLLSLNNVHIKCAFIYFYRYTLWKKKCCQRDIFTNKILIRMPNKRSLTHSFIQTQKSKLHLVKFWKFCWILNCWNIQFCI